MYLMYLRESKNPNRIPASKENISTYRRLALDVELAINGTDTNLDLGRVTEVDTEPDGIYLSVSLMWNREHDLAKYKTNIAKQIGTTENNIQINRIHSERMYVGVLNEALHVLVEKLSNESQSNNIFRTYLIRIRKLLFRKD